MWGAVKARSEAHLSKKRRKGPRIYRVYKLGERKAQRKKLINENERRIMISDIFVLDFRIDLYFSGPETQTRTEKCELTVLGQ